MWFIYAIIHCFLLALVNYSDEYLNTHNKVPQKSDIHTRIGGVLLISCLMSFAGAFFIVASTGNVLVPLNTLLLVFLSAVPMVITYAYYFYMLTLYPPHLIVPLFQISSIWLLLFEFLAGETISTLGLIGILILMIGAYILDAGTIKWQIPSKLLLIAIPLTSAWSISLFLVRTASSSASTSSITFWQLLGIGVIGFLLLIFVRKYREGFLFRVKNQGKVFLGISAFNESVGQLGYFFANLAVALAPVAAYVTAMSGVQGIFILGLFYFFPQGERTKISLLQVMAIALIAIGVFLIEGMQ